MLIQSCIQRNSGVMKTRVLIQQGQIVKPGQQLWKVYAGCSNSCDATWALHLAVPLIVAFYWRDVVFEGPVDVEVSLFHLGVLKRMIFNLCLGRAVALHK